MITPEELQRLCGKFTLDQLRAEADREIGQRLDVYPRLILKKSLTKERANEQTDKMRAIAAILAALAEKDPRAAGRLL